MIYPVLYVLVLTILFFRKSEELEEQLMIFPTAGYDYTQV